MKRLCSAAPVKFARESIPNSDHMIWHLNRKLMVVLAWAKNKHHFILGKYMPMNFRNLWAIVGEMVDVNHNPNVIRTGDFNQTYEQILAVY